MDYQSLVDFQYWTFIAQICNLFIQMFLFKKFLFKPVKAMMEKRRQEVSQLYSQAEEAKSAAEESRSLYEGKLEAADQEAAAIVQNATLRANKRSDEILSEASEKAAALRQKADSDIAQERRKAINELKNDVSRMAVDIAGKIVEREVTPADHEKLVNEFIEKMGDET